MKKFTILLIALVTGLAAGSSALAAGGHGAVEDKVYLNMSDKASLQNGAKLFMNYCLACHSAEYSRYERVATDLDIPLYQLKENLMFTTEKPGDLMKTTMPAEDAKSWFGVAPPDLSLVARVRGSDWIYTYLRAFYQDESTPSGWNNSLFANVAMPHSMYELQGVQRLVKRLDAHDLASASGHDAEPLAANQKLVGDAIFELQHTGKMTPAEFDKSIADLTGFLTYLGEPAQLQRKTIGVYTLTFLIILLLLCMLLKKEYWRDVH
ncbi:cytochrome c1 [Arenicella xantha]|uniref:Ubiquinol-cytochrome c reductase cytochrome c1 subunit n=1 Tax=Arenicella xantha TaxID=644221 RepID=A0A395JNU2_9GAMM|nr:cytochrome c1 [Arenicella xantha]RBP53330.1 ubiquinol-cytochrome c reductase cytochrome c1 subunit [Arenicella xantha]